MVWNFLIAVNILCLQAYVGYHIAYSLREFTYPRVLVPYIIASYSLLFVDLCLAFNTQFYEKGQLVHSRSYIAVNVLKDYFWIRVLPFIGFIYRLLWSFKILKINTITQNVLDFLFIFKMTEVFDIINKYIILFKLSKKLIGFIYLVSLMLKLMLMLHWSTCAWLVLLDYTAGSQRTNFFDFFALTDVSNLEIYWTNMYWFMTTVSTVGFGDFYPMSSLERVYMTGIMIFSALFFGYLVNAIGKFMIENQNQEISIKIKLATINSEFKQKKVEKGVSILVLRYLEYALKQDHPEGELANQTILNSLHPDMKFEIMKEIYVKIFQQIKGFDEIPDSVLAKLAQHAEECRFAPGNVIIDETSHRDDLSLYYIESGDVIVYLKESDTYLKQLSAKEVFGEFSFFTGSKRFSSVKAKDYVTAVKFKRKYLIRCFDNIGKEHLNKFKYMVSIYNDFSAFDIICYSCRGRNHTAKQCKYTHMEINKRNLIRSKKVETNERKNWIRRNRRAFVAMNCQIEIYSAIMELNHDIKKSKFVFNSVTDHSNEVIEMPGSNKIGERKGTKKRKSRMRTLKYSTIINEIQTDRVYIPGYNLKFWENSNIEKICSKFMAPVSRGAGGFSSHLYGRRSLHNPGTPLLSPTNLENKKLSNHTSIMYNRASMIFRPNEKANAEQAKFKPPGGS